MKTIKYFVTELVIFKLRAIESIMDLAAWLGRTYRTVRPAVNNPRGRHWARNLADAGVTAVDWPTLYASLRNDVLPTVTAALIEPTLNLSTVKPHGRRRAPDAGWTWEKAKPARAAGAHRAAIVQDVGIALLPIAAAALRTATSEMATVSRSSDRESTPPRDTARRTGAHRLATLTQNAAAMATREIHVTGALRALNSLTRAPGEMTWKDVRRAERYA